MHFEGTQTFRPQQWPYRKHFPYDNDDDDDDIDDDDMIKETHDFVLDETIEPFLMRSVVYL